VFGCRTPVVSAIGHEPDSPLLDHVADVRCSTPTDAGKRVVPDLAEQTEQLLTLRHRARRCVSTMVEREQQRLDAFRSRPALARPTLQVDAREEELAALRTRVRRCLGHRLDTANAELIHVRARIGALSPQATLDRGYAIVQRRSVDGGWDGVIRKPDEVSAGEEVRLRLAGGERTAHIA